MGRLRRLAGWADRLPLVHGRFSRLLASAAPESVIDRFTLFAGPGHFYSPIPDHAEVTRRAASLFDTSRTSVPSIDIDDAAMVAFAEECVAFHAEFPFTDRPGGRFRYHTDNGFFNHGDGLMLYSFLRRFRPRRIVEVGSGFSSAEMLDVNEAAFGGSIEMTFIEPYPERLRGLLREGDAARCRIIESPVQDVQDDVFRALGENDILFIDSSHVAKAGSDVVHLVSNVLPLLAKGVIVHVHDIFWPFEYPRVWLDAGRAWNEIYMVKAFLQFNSAFRILYFNSYMECRHAEFLRRTLPIAMSATSSPEAPGNTSLWLRKTA